MTTIDTNISNYTLSELLAIIDMPAVETIDPDEVTRKTDKIIKMFQNKNPDLAVFFKQVRSQLLQYAQGLKYVDRIDDGYILDDGYNRDIVDGDSKKIIVESFAGLKDNAIYPVADEQISEWYTNEHLMQSDQNQVDKITDRKQKIGFFGNEHIPMKQEQIATTDTYQLPVKQDSLNPNLKNTISRFVNLDSQFRQYTSGVDSTSTDYTLDLSDTLKNALNLRLYSYQIPFSWYTIDTAYNNTCFWIIDASSGNSVAISIPSGNYSQKNFVTQLISSITNAGFSNFPTVNGNIGPVYYNENNGIIQLLLNGAKFKENDNTIFTVSPSSQILFYDFTGFYRCNTSCYNVSNHFFNSSLGWIMGYRVPYVYVEPSGNSASAILDLNGTKYLILAIDDYNQNHVNNTLVSISQLSNALKIPSYYSNDLPYTCITPSQQLAILEQQGGSLEQLVAQVTASSQNYVNGLLIAGKYERDYTDTQQFSFDLPRTTLTQAQIYTINQINKNGNNITNYLSKAPTSSDILAVLPVKTSAGVPTGSLLVEFSGSLQDNIRTYFGPVNIERMAVKLLDDKGNVLNLNGNDWCVTLVCECLYQY